MTKTDLLANRKLRLIYITRIDYNELWSPPFIWANPQSSSCKPVYHVDKYSTNNTVLNFIKLAFKLSVLHYKTVMFAFYYWRLREEWWLTILLPFWNHDINRHAYYVINTIKFYVVNVRCITIAFICRFEIVLIYL